MFQIKSATVTSLRESCLVAPGWRNSINNCGRRKQCSLSRLGPAIAHHFPVPLKSQSSFSPPATLLGTRVKILNKPSLTFLFNELPTCVSLFVCALQNRLDIKNGSILRLTKAPVSLSPVRPGAALLPPPHIPPPGTQVHIFTRSAPMRQ